MTTSYSSALPLTYSAASWCTSVSRASPNDVAVDVPRYLRETSHTFASISHIVIRSTPACRHTSRSTPPSPPPTMSTERGFGWQCSGRCAIISWYACSSRSVSWITPSSTSTVPYVDERNTRMSWKSDRDSCSTSSTLRPIAWPGHITSLS